MKKEFFFLFPLAAMLFFLNACEDDDPLQVDLPVIITDYLDSNYANHEIEEAEMDTLCTGTAVYEVEIETSDDDELDLTFDTEGNLLFTEKEIKNSELPSAVSDAVAAAYPNHSLEEAEMLDMFDNSTRYEVEVKNGQETLEVLLESDGTVVCEAVDDED